MRTLHPKTREEKHKHVWKLRLFGHGFIACARDRKHVRLWWFVL